MIPVPHDPCDFYKCWDMVQAYPWVKAMRGSTQDPVHHAEGDVHVHTRLVCEALCDDPAYASLSPDLQTEVYLGALLHDVAKPHTRKEENGRVGNPGHSVKGEIDARVILWELGGYPFGLRERVCALVRAHQLPYFAFGEGYGDKKVIQASLRTRCDLLGMLARADINGRVCPDADKALESIALFGMMAEDLECASTPFAFASDHSRYEYFQKVDRDPRYAAYDTTTFEVTVMCGLPGSGKDTWLRNHAPGLPVVSLDDLRDEMDVEHGDTSGQGRVAQAAKEQAKVYLRAKTPFAWNATNLSTDVRRKVLNLLGDYGARIRIVYVEAPASRLWHQNRSREASVPEEAIRGMLRKWQVPDITEAHSVVHAVSP